MGKILFNKLKQGNIMGYHVKIRKLFEKKEDNFVIHCYKVEGGNYNDEGCFYICINPDLKIINFYQ